MPRVSAARFWTEPFRVLFPLAALSGVLGMGAWFASLRGWVSPLQTAQHGLFLLLGVVGAGMLGFLGTAYPRQNRGPHTGRAEVLLGGRRRPVVGRISMDQSVVDVSDDAVTPGEVATVFGPGCHGEPLVADWAHWADTIEHEIVTGIGPRVTRTTRPARGQR